MATILKKNKCVEYGIGDDGMLFLFEYGGGFLMDDTHENRWYIEKEFDEWSKITYNCKNCPYECK